MKDYPSFTHVCRFQSYSGRQPVMTKDKATPRNPGSSPCHARAPKVTASSASPASVAGAWLGSLPRLTDLQVGEETACPTRCGPVWKSEIQTIKSAAKSCSSKAIQSLALQGPCYMPPPSGTCGSLGLCQCSGLKLGPPIRTVHAKRMLHPQSLLGALLEVNLQG